MINATSCTSVLWLIIFYLSSWVDHVDAWRCCSYHHPATITSMNQRTTQTMKRYNIGSSSIGSSSAPVHRAMHVIRHPSTSRLSLVHPSHCCTLAIDTSSSCSYSRRGMSVMILQAGAPGIYIFLPYDMMHSRTDDDDDECYSTCSGWCWYMCYTG